ncbi:outer membrane protein assembly factor BamD [Breoghania sp.]|uniref:outer membrane protein assembly factor BamD n=1 Tax=Breoghania sp. TaxID=2065378 RepID=UPI002628C940|nr:outer membrane protein assembly factor BamD [Breoghania sp.]MDJ0931160.1 outer membrane protein assembly factor BamD [Breoghania sp.]
MSRGRSLGRVLPLVAALALAACASKKPDDLAMDDTPADQLYNEGLAFRAAGDLKEATKKFEDVDRLHPYSEYARKSLINLAFTNYSRGEYAEAITVAKRFATLYPGSPDAAYALYIMGNSYFKQMPDVTRDQQVTAKALSIMRELVRRYPDSEYAADVRKKIRVTTDQLAGKEMETGRYYLKRHNYVAAINRFRYVVEHYQETRHIEEALSRLTEAYYALGVVNEAQTAVAVLGHNYPESQWYKDSYTLLKKGGYEPSANPQSWISKAFESTKVL